MLKPHTISFWDHPTKSSKGRSSYSLWSNSWLHSSTNNFVSAIIVLGFKLAFTCKVVGYRFRLSICSLQKRVLSKSTKLFYANRLARFVTMRILLLLRDFYTWPHIWPVIWFYPTYYANFIDFALLSLFY